MWGKSLLDLAPTCLLEPAKPQVRGDLDAGKQGKTDQHRTALREDHVRERARIEAEIEQIAFSLGRESVAPSYPIPSIITEWASSSKCPKTG